jgi:hypothetical protein
MPFNDDSLSRLLAIPVRSRSTPNTAGWLHATLRPKTRTLAELRTIIETNEASADDFVIVHFLKDRLTDDPGCPCAHISPIGAYDAASGRVLVLDIDREYYGPYWVSVEQLLIAVSASTPTYGHGGVLIVRRISK